MEAVQLWQTQLGQIDQLVMDFCQSHGVSAFVPTLTTDLCMATFYGMPAKYAEIWYPQVTVVEPA